MDTFVNEKQLISKNIVLSQPKKYYVFILALYNDTSIRYPEFNTDFNRLLSIVLSHQHFTLDLDEIGENVIKKYFPSGKIEDHSHLKTLEV